MRRDNLSQPSRRERMPGGATAVRVVGVWAIITVLLLSIGAGSALAVQTHLFLSKTEVPGGEHRPGDIAAANASGHLYVANLTVSDGGVYNFGANGKLDPAVPRFAGAPTLRAFSLAVDNSGGSGAETVWVGSVANREVVQFSAAGIATGVNLTSASLPPDGTAQGGGLPPIVNDGDFRPRGLAVDAAGNLYVADSQASDTAVDKFSSDGLFIAQLAAGTFEEGIDGIAVDSTGHIWVASSSQEGGLFELDQSGNCIEAGCDPTVADRIGGVAANRSSGTILTPVIDTFEDGGHGHFSEFDEEGNLLGVSGSDVLRIPIAIAVNESNGNVFVADTNAKSFLTFGPVTILPDAVTETATEVGASGATFHGQVGADGGPEATCRFQYVDEAGFQLEGFAQARSVDCSPAGPFTGEALNSVSATVDDLNGGTTYHYRLLGTSANGSTPGEDIPFTTEGPRIRAQSVSAITETAARLEATINPNGVETSYFFEYVDDARFQASEFTQATRVPLPALSIGGGLADVPVAQQIGGLAPGTGYHFRVIAIDGNGAESQGPDSRFVTFPPATPHLPDGRAYEQVSPVDKNGNDIKGEANAVQAAASGGAVTFYSNAGLPGGTGGQNFGVYQANRAADGTGWMTEGLLPEASAGPLAMVLGWSENLTDTYVSAKQVGQPATLYDRQRGGGLTAMAIDPKNTFPYRVAASSADTNAVYFETIPDSKSSKPANAFVWDRETEVPVPAGVMNNGKAPSKGAFPGPYDWFKEHTTEIGGTSASYYTQATHALSTDGRRAFFTEAETGQLYMRENPLQPQSAVDGEGNCTQPGFACTVRISAPSDGVPDPNQPAAFLEATPDGGQVYFLSAGQLTADSTALNGAFELYRYDVATGGLTDLTVDESAENPNGADVQGLVASVGDGSHVYFVANGVLAPGATLGSCSPGGLTGQCNLYVWHGGEIDFIAMLNAAPGSPQESAGHFSDERNWAPTTFLPSRALFENTSRATTDGQTLLFRSRQQLTDYRNNGVPELYLFRPGAPLSCVSCNPTGTPPTGPAGLQSLISEQFAAVSLEFGVLTRNLSSSGTRVFFDTPDSLVANDINGVRDVYEWEAAGTGTCTSSQQNGGCLYLLSGGTSPSPSFFGDASADGNDAFFLTRQGLVRQDRDELVDMYDARVGGGIASQNPSEPPICDGEGCAFAPGGAPSSSPVGSTAPQAGNPVPKRCKKGARLVVKRGKERCVKVKRHKRHKKHHRGKKHKKSKRQSGNWQHRYGHADDEKAGRK